MGILVHVGIRGKEYLFSLDFLQIGAYAPFHYVVLYIVETLARTRQ